MATIRPCVNKMWSDIVLFVNIHITRLYIYTTVHRGHMTESCSEFPFRIHVLLTNLKLYGYIGYIRADTKLQTQNESHSLLQA